MSTSKIFHCIVDDTALITNISEIEAWVQRGSIALVVPLHTLERLHLLKKDTSQIGQNARKAVKFLDEATSDPEVKVVIQEPDDQYQTWAQVEAHYLRATSSKFEQKENVAIGEEAGEEDIQQQSNGKVDIQDATHQHETNDELPDLVINKMTISKDSRTSPMSTPPLSPSSSGPQSTKTSPEVKSATMIANDLSPVPPTLKTLINPVVWYTHEKQSALKNIVFLTNSSDTAYIARDFGVSSKNIHQLRAAVGIEEQEAKNHDKYQKRHGSNTTSRPPSEPRTLFRYEEEESEDEVVVFKPRNRGSAKVPSGSRSTHNGSGRNRSLGHSPANSLNGSLPLGQPKPQIPIEEIDPDSFDRGGFARGSTPLVSVGNHAAGNLNTTPRGSVHRGNHSIVNMSRGGQHKGSVRGSDRGASRGRGRLFIP